MSIIINEGDQAPQFSITTDTGTFSMAEAKGPVVVFFFPKADTPGCTKEAIAFSQLKAEFDALNTTVIGISKDKAAKQGKFREKHDLTCALGVFFGVDMVKQEERQRAVRQGGEAASGSFSKARKRAARCFSAFF